MYKKIAQLALLFIFSITLSSCSLFKNNKNKQITLQFWGIWDQSETINEIKNEFKKNNPNIEIIYTKKSIQQYRESLESQITSGTGPDIFVFHNTWVPMLRDELEPVPQFVLSSNEFKNNYYPAANRDLRSLDNKFLGAPTGTDGLALFYNEDILKAAGIIAPPKTWEELAQIAAKITVKGPDGNIRTAGVALGTTNNIDYFSDIVALMILQNLGDPKILTDQRSADAIDYYIQFAKGQNRVWDETMQSSTLAFYAGNLAMYFGPSSKVKEIKDKNPNLNFKVAPLPQLEGGKVAWASYWAVGVSAKSKGKEAAQEFLKYLQDDQTQINLFTLASKNSSQYSGQPYPKQSLASKIATDPYFGAYVVDAPFAKSFPVASYTFDNGINDQIIAVYKKGIDAVISGGRSKTALEEATKSIEKLLAKYGVN